MAGKMILAKGSENENTLHNKIIKTFVSGTLLLVFGFLLSYACPISKKNLVADLCHGNMWLCVNSFGNTYLLCRYEKYKMPGTFL